MDLLDGDDSVHPNHCSNYEFTDLGNAAYFVDRVQDRVRFDTGRNRWLVWHQHRWEPDKTLQVEKEAQRIAQERTKEAAAMPRGDDVQIDRRERTLRWALISEGLWKIEASLRLAKPQLAVSTASGWDADPWLLGVPNGVVDLRTGVLRDGHRDDRITKHAGVPFDPFATCPRWERFLEEILGDPSVVAFQRKALGYTLTGNVKEDCWFGCHGTGRNGKSTQFKALIAVFGDYGYTAGFSLVERGRGESRRDFDIAYLQNTRFVMASETRDGTTWDEERLKKLTGGDPLHAEIKFGAEFDFLPSHKLWFMFNHQPRARDHSIGFWRRVRLIPFARQFSDADGTVDKHLESKLQAEYMGILAWLVRGCLEWQREGLTVPQVILDATAQYERDEDPLNGFTQKYIAPAKGERFSLKDAFALYQQWCRDEHITSQLGRTRFGTLLDAKFKRYNLNGSAWYRDARLGCNCVFLPGCPHRKSSTGAP